MNESTLVPDSQLSRDAVSATNGSRVLAALAACALCLGGQISANAQVFSDDFDSYSNTTEFTAAGWHLSALNPALVTTTFPTVDTGKGLRIVANPVPEQAPAVGMWYRTQEYTDFYVAVDIVDWPGTDKNQAMVLFARLTDAATGTVTPNLNPAAGQGVIANYDASQYGENPGDRRQGQLQINVVQAGFATTTLAVAEITFVPGRAYRLVFKGVGSRLTTQAYDLHDLIQPLVTLEAEDNTFTSGACGILGFSRQGQTGTVDVTLDNYYAGPTDPNPAPALALAHPIGGTPQVVTRTPAHRWANFHDPAQGISFTAQTFPENVIDASATKLFLNGADVSTALQPFPADGSTVTFATAPGTLAPNQVYQGRIELQDATGALTSVNTFWFDTFSEDFISTLPVRTIECEDYNYSGGQYLADPIPLSGIRLDGSDVNYGAGYVDRIGTSEVDYRDNRTTIETGWNQYRLTDLVGTSRGNQDITDLTRQLNDPLPGHLRRAAYAAVDLEEYFVARTEPGEWLNYTRSFANTNYAVYLRVGSFGATQARLDRVTGNATQPDQTTEPLGIVDIPNNIMHINYTYVPLTDAGRPVLVPLSGVTTLRLTMLGTEGQDNRKVYLNYLLFVPAVDDPVLPQLAIIQEGDSVKVSWPRIPWRLERSLSLTTPVWTEVTTGITADGDQYGVVQPATDSAYYRLVNP
jgi:hypothetical protein